MSRGSSTGTSIHGFPTGIGIGIGIGIAYLLYLLTYCLLRYSE